LIYPGTPGEEPNQSSNQAGGSTFLYGKGGVPSGEDCGQALCPGAGGWGGYVSQAPPGELQPESGAGGGSATMVYLAAHGSANYPLIVAAAGGGGGGGTSRWCGSSCLSPG